MFNLLKLPQNFANGHLMLSNRLVNQSHKLLKTARPFVLFINCSSQVNLFGRIQGRSLLLNNTQPTVIFSRKASRSKKKVISKNLNNEEESDDDSEEEEDADDGDKQIDGSDVKTYLLNSCRIDLILKQVFKQKRKKIEEVFYDNRIRINGRVLLKKGSNAKPGDEIDLIKGFVKNNEELLEISRLEILDISNRDEENGKLKVKIRKYKNLVIENYTDEDMWKEPNLEA